MVLSREQLCHLAEESEIDFILNTNGPVIVDNIKTEKRFFIFRILYEHNVVSGLSVIIHGKVTPWGILSVYSSRYRVFSQDDVNFLQSVANILAELIEYRQKEYSLYQSEQKFRGLLNSASDGMIVPLQME